MWDGVWITYHPDHLSFGDGCPHFFLEQLWICSLFCPPSWFAGMTSPPQLQGKIMIRMSQSLWPPSLCWDWFRHGHVTQSCFWDLIGSQPRDIWKDFFPNKRLHWGNSFPSFLPPSLPSFFLFFLPFIPSFLSFLPSFFGCGVMRSYHLELVAWKH